MRREKYGLRGGFSPALPLWLRVVDGRLRGHDEQTDGIHFGGLMPDLFFFNDVVLGAWEIY
jgi:hypothetical protein